MNAERLLQHFERISEAPDAIPRLRQFILDLAVRGKLVEHDPNDEPASELLKRFQAEQARLAKDGKIRGQGPLQPVNDTTLPFAVPRHWVWLQLREIGTLSGGMTPSKNRSDYWEGEINWFSPKDIKSDELVESELKITSAGVAETGLQLYPVGCLFMVARSGILKRTFPVSINRVKATVNQDLKVLNPFIEGLERYLQIMFRGMTDFILSALVKTGTTVQSLRYEEFELQPLPLPPLAEQHRIVAKVDELMALCDQLEAAKTEREQSRDRLVAASLHRLNSPADTAETDVPDLPARQADAFRDHARFVFNHLPRLTTRPEHIKQLRQTILNLAVCGKLVPQDPNDEPAAELLKRIQAEKAKLVKEGKIRKQDPQPEIEEDEMTFALPNLWASYRLGNVIHLVSGQHLQPGEYSDQKGSGTPYITGPADFGENGLVITRYATVRKSVAAAGQILLTVKGAGVGKTTICDLLEVAISRQLMAMTAIEWSQHFLLLTTHRLASVLRESARSLIPGISREDVEQFVFPLPPLAEQHRIVARVDELMALCDQLEAQFTTTEADSRRLLEAVLHEALNPPLEATEQFGPVAGKTNAPHN